MTYFKNVNIAASDSPSIDAFSRWRTSEPNTLFASNHEYNESPEFWESVLTGTGTATHIAAQAAVRMRTTTTSGDKVVRQTYRYFRYMPGKSQLIALTGVVGASATNVRKRLGYFDASNGIFFEQSGGTFKVVRRTNVTGTPVDNVVLQSAFNLDKLDGTGTSGFNIDLSKANIFIIDLQWLGVGRVRLGVDIDGVVTYCHEFLNANNLTTVYMTTANLPVRYEIENTGTAVSATNDFFQICSTVVSEGGKESELQARLRSANNGTTVIGVTTRRALLTIRPKATFNSIVNRAYIQPVAIEFVNSGNQVMLVEVVRGHALGGVPAWTSAGATSTVEYDVAGTTITGGEVIWSGYSPAAANAGKLEVPLDNILNADIPLTLNSAGTTPILFSVVATSFGASSNSATAITWKEVY